MDVPACDDDDVVLLAPCGGVTHCEDAAVAVGGAAVVDEVRHVAGTRRIHLLLIVQSEDVRAWTADTHTATATSIQH